LLSHPPRYSLFFSARRTSPMAAPKPEELVSFESAGGVPITLWRWPDTGFSVRTLAPCAGGLLSHSRAHAPALRALR
jgi:hypothetical protein